MKQLTHFIFKSKNLKRISSWVTQFMVHGSIPYFVQLISETSSACFEKYPCVLVKVQRHLTVYGMKRICCFDHQIPVAQPSWIALQENFDFSAAWMDIVFKKGFTFKPELVSPNWGGGCSCFPHTIEETDSSLSSVSQMFPPKWRCFVLQVHTRVHTFIQPGVILLALAAWREWKTYMSTSI